MKKLEYDEKTVTLWLRVGNKRYMLCQASGEMIANDGRDISDYYWDGHADEVKALFRSLDGFSFPPLYNSIRDYIDNQE
jgi:hypothetical protein